MNYQTLGILVNQRSRVGAVDGCELVDWSATDTEGINGRYQRGRFWKGEIA